MIGPLFLITGAPGAGKSATAVALMRRFPFGLHIAVDDLRESVVSGIAHPIPEFTDETARQFRLARTAAAQIACIYADAGFAVVIDDVVHDPDAETCFIALLAPRTVHKILLQPTVEVALARNAGRTNKSFDPIVLTKAIYGNHHSLAEQNRSDLGWRVIYNSDLGLEQTADVIIEGVLGAIRNFRRLAPNLITGGQPGEEQLALAAAAGIEVVVNLALHGAPYSLSDERATVLGLGMTYEHIPVTWERPTAADLDAFFAVMQRHARRRIFLHCAANYRASAFIMLYRVLRLGWRIEDALPDMRAIWNPAEYPAWQALIDAVLAT